MSNNEQMKNAKWKMTNDPVATAPGTETIDTPIHAAWFTFSANAKMPIQSKST
jgi:hypothetical protein